LTPCSNEEEDAREEESEHALIAEARRSGSWLPLGLTLAGRCADQEGEMRNRIRSPYVGIVVSVVGFTVGGITLLYRRR
jgi:hypothetical protein